MSREPTPVKTDLSQIAPPRLSELAWPALVWALIAALVLSLLYTVWDLAVYLNQVEHHGWVGWLQSGWVLRSVKVFGICWAILFLLRWIFTHRLLADRVFAIVGFTATFFGLAILVFFFSSLAWSTYLWFHYTPQYIEANNKKLRAEIAAAKNTEQFVNNHKRMQRALRELKRQLARFDDRLAEAKVKGAGENKLAKIQEARRKKEETYKKIVFPLVRTELKAQAERILKENPRDIREDTSPWAIFYHFITAGPSSKPQNTGIWFAILASLWVALITMCFAVPVGVGAALYLEEYRTQDRKNWLGNLIQVNINNLAGVPSVVYGMLGGFVFVYLIFQPLHHHVDPNIDARNLLGGGLTLGLLTLPIVIVAAQEAIRAVPQSIRHGAYALGATQWQVISRTVLPSASPGILTGTILAVSRALGEAAPMILFGAMLYVDQRPGLFTRFTVLPMQIFSWVKQANWPVGDGRYLPIWRWNASVAILVLLLILIGLNTVAIVLRNRAQRGMRD